MYTRQRYLCLVGDLIILRQLIANNNYNDLLIRYDTDNRIEQIRDD